MDIINTNHLVSYHFQILDNVVRVQMEDCIQKFKNNYFNYSEPKLRYALTNAYNSFWLTQCSYMPDGIKHCNEPDDYEYSIITESSIGVVHMQGNEIKQIKGEISLTAQELMDAINFYNKFRFDWERHNNF